MRTTCRECGGPLPPTATKSRPRVYCSTGCKRAREYAVKRVARQLDQCERAAQLSRVNGWSPDRWEDEAVPLREQLRQLLDDEEETP